MENYSGNTYKSLVASDNNNYNDQEPGPENVRNNIAFSAMVSDVYQAYKP